MFVYQATFSISKTRLTKKKTSTEYSIGWKSKGVYTSKLIGINSILIIIMIIFLPNIKYFEKKLGIKFNDTSLLV